MKFLEALMVIGLLCLVALAVFGVVIARREAQARRVPYIPPPSQEVLHKLGEFATWRIEVEQRIEKLEEQRGRAERSLIELNLGISRVEARLAQMQRRG